MWTRAELKQRGKFAFKKKYWASVLVSLVLMIATGTASSGGTGAYNSATRFSGNGNALNDYSGYGGSAGFNYNMLAIAGIAFGVIAIVGIIALLLSLFVWHPLEVGGRRYFMENREEDTRFDVLGYAFKSGHYGNVVLTMFLRKLFTALWTLLLIIPGIIKSYEYRMIPYILSENPGMNYKDAFSISKNMMMGEKWNLFVLDVSWIGWMILTLCTCGILGIFYTNPYVYATEAELYAVLRAHAFHVGGVTTNELPGFGTVIY